MPNLGGWEFVILIGILVLLFGAKRLPDMARSIGQSARVFKGEMKGMKNDDSGRDAPAAQPADPPARPAELPPARETPAKELSAGESAKETSAQETSAQPSRARQADSSNTGQ